MRFELHRHYVHCSDVCRVVFTFRPLQNCCVGVLIINFPTRVGRWLEEVPAEHGASLRAVILRQVAEII